MEVKWALNPPSALARPERAGEVTAGQGEEGWTDVCEAGRSR